MNKYILKSTNFPLFINARFLTQRTTGVQKFAIELCRCMVNLNSEITFLAPHNIQHKQILENWNVKIIGKLKGHAWEQSTLPSYLKKNGRPLLLNLCNTAPLNYSNQVVTIHDVAFLVNPQWFSKTFRNYYKFLIRQIARSSKKIFTVSNTSKSGIVTHLNIDEEKISVVYNGVPYDFLSMPGDSPTVNDKYLLYVGSMDPRKNIATAIKAFQLLNQKDLKLIIVGGTNSLFAKSNLKDLVKDDSRIILKGYTDINELKNLYVNARSLIMPSFYEGFGLPIIESLSMGCPVVASDIPVFRELFGDSILYAQPDDAQTFANQLNYLLGSEPHRNEMILKGKLICSKYDYSQSALTVLNNLLPLLTAK